MIEEHEKRTLSDFVKSYMNNLQKECEAHLVAFKARMENIEEESKAAQEEIRLLKNSLKGYKKTFSQVARLAKEATSEMNTATNKVHSILADYDPIYLKKILEILEITVDTGHYIN